MRSEIDISKNPDLSKIKGFERITTAIRYKFSQSKLYLGMKNKQEDRIKQERIMTREKIRNVLLHRLSHEFNKTDVETVEISISREFESYLDDVLNSMDFYSYDIERSEENPDYLVAFPNMDIKLICRRKQL